jgi:histidinol-phosphate/aromatic aminotransferase/cobyric acid decarboxylase-like protein
MTIGTPQENDQLIDALRDVMATHPAGSRPVSR